MLTTTAAAAQGVATLPGVEVIGVSPVPGVDVPRERIPAHVQSAYADDIERSRAADLAQFMRRRLGSVHVAETQNNPFQPDVSFRGYTASPLLGTAQGLSVYLDGVRLNQPFGDVVSWDLVPRAAIASMTLNAGSNPLFGLNTLGGALAVQTKDGRRHPGTSLQLQAGSHGRAALEFETGGAHDGGLHWYLAGHALGDAGWREASGSQLRQLFAKAGQRFGDTDVALTLAAARTGLDGAGLQDGRLLARDAASVYTRPDTTRNRSLLVNLAVTHELGGAWSAAGHVYHRRIRTSTFNGDLNEAALGEPLVQPTPAELAALGSAGYAGVPASGEDAANTPFPKWRCIASALLGTTPATLCNGVLNRTRTEQQHQGFAAQLDHDGLLFGRPSQSFVGAAYDASRSRFVQGSELGYLGADRAVTGVGAFGDGASGGTLDGAPYDTRVDLAGRTHTASVYASSVVELARGTHLTLAGRYNDVAVRNRDAIRPGGGPGSLDGDQRFRRLNPALGVTFTPKPGVNAWIGASQGSRAPSSVELGCADPAQPCKLPNAFAGDPPLRQVVTTTLEAGLRGRTAGGLAWSAGVFRSDNRDDLLFVADDASGFGYFRNFGRTRRQGVELSASAALARSVVVGANYTWLDATFRSGESVMGASNSSNSAAQQGSPGVDGTIAIRPGDRIPLVPRQILKLYADVELGDAWAVGADVAAQGGAPARGNENGQHRPDGVFYLGPGRSAGHAVLNLTLEHRPTRALRLFAIVNNALDRRYNTAAQLGPTGFDDAGRYVAQPFAADANGERPLRHATFFAPGAPRSVFVGLRYSFGGAAR